RAQNGTCRPARSRSSPARRRRDRARAPPGPPARTRTRPSARGTAATAPGPRGRKAACLRSGRSPPRSAPSPRASRLAAARSSWDPEPVGVGGDVVLRDAEVLRRVDGDPEALVPVRAQLALGSQRRERGRLVVALLGQPLERLLAEDVDAAAHPVREPRLLLEAEHRVVLV